MSTGRLISVALVVVLCALMTSGSAGGQQSDDDCCRAAQTPGGAVSSHSVTSWAAALAGGGVQRPGGASGPACTQWASATGINPVSVTDVSSFRVDPDGVTAELYFRDCGTIRQLVWVRRETPRSLSRLALSDLRSTALVLPEVQMSPPDRGIVNLETWLAVTSPGPIEATAAIPGLSVTATAVIESTTFDFGNGDHVTCDGAGVPWTDDLDPEAAAPCGYTYRARNEHGSPFRVTVTMTWRASWRATSGATGGLGTIESAPTTIEYPVHEIQTIGVAG
jgi:hypothetical protein